ncbi:hypothetical protein D3C71_762660 [compost metagenome]|jgi:uncharacterized protein (TIGR02246 family)
MTTIESTTSMLHKLYAEQCCRELVLRSAALVDAGDAQGLADLFSADAELVRPTGEVLRGRDAIEGAYRSRSAARMTAHFVAGTFFEEMGRESARAQTRVLLWAGQSNFEAGTYRRVADPIQIMGRFEDRFVKTSQGWRIARRRSVFDLHLA